MNLPLRALRPVPLHSFADADDGMSTVEYAVGTVGAAVLGLLVYQMAKSKGVVDAFTDLILHSLKVDF